MEAGRGSGDANLDVLRSFYGNRAVADLTGSSGRIAVAALAAAAAEPSEIRLLSLAPGPYGGWYVLMSRLPGVPLGTVWDQLSAAGWDRLAGQLREAVACCTI
jgi:hypothetical protein